MTKSYIALSTAASILVSALTGIELDYAKIVESMANCATRIIGDGGLLGLARDIAHGWVKDGLTRFTILGYAHSYPTALEASLKFTETSYVPAVALGALEFRHGPVATVGERQVIILMGQPTGFMKHIVKLAEDLKALSKGSETRLLVVTSDDELASASGSAIKIPCSSGYGEWDPLILLILIYLLAYHYAVGRGIDVDRPRNLTRVVKEF